MTCKDCIHGEMCANRNKMVQIDEHTWDEYEQTDNVEKLCKHFKNKTDFVEVIRCKDCKCYKEYLHHNTKEPTGWGKCTKIEMDIDLASNDFCSYGERTQRKEG